MLMRTPRRSRRTPVVWTSALLVAMSGLLLGCEDDDDDAPAEARVVQPVPLASADDVARAVAAVWVGARPLIGSTAPTRPQPTEPTESGQVTEECSDGGQIVYDQDAQTTSFEDCRTVTAAEPDPETGAQSTLEVVENGLVDEDCGTPPPQGTPRCLGRAIQTEITESTQADAESEPMTTRSAVVLDDSQTVINEREAGYTARTDRRARANLNDGESATELALEYFDYAVAVDDVGSEEEPQFVLNIDGNLSVDANDSSLCNSGELRVGTVSALQIDPDAGTAPTGGSIVLSTSAIGALQVDFLSDSSIQFTLDGAPVSVAAADIDGLCLASYSAGSDDPDGGEEDGGQLCLPGSDILCLPGL